MRLPFLVQDGIFIKKAHDNNDNNNDANELKKINLKNMHT